MRDHALRRRAWREGVGLLIVLALAAGAGVYASQQPTDATGLKAEVSVVRSQAAAAALLAEQASDLPGPFVRAHSEQLGKNIERQAKRVQELNVEPSLEQSQQKAAAGAQRLQQIVKPWADDEASVASAALPELVAQLQAIEQSLRR